MVNNMQHDTPAGFSLPQKRLLFTLSGIQFTHILDFMVMMPLGPMLTSQFALSDLQFGYLVSAYTFSAALSSLAAATYVDRFERKRLMLFLYLAFAIATGLCALAPGYLSLLAARVAAGCFGGVLTALTNTIVAESIPLNRRGEAMGIVMRAFAISTVAGVPASLFLANAFSSWRAPFVVIAVIALVLCAIAQMQLPTLRTHLDSPIKTTAFSRIREVISEVNHWRAYLFSMLLVLSSFPVIPYITIYTTANLKLTLDQVPYLYLAGGLATFFTARLFGQWADRFGKVRVYRAIALTSIFPLLAITHVKSISFAGLIVITTIFFIFISGRLVPASAIVSSAAAPHIRGTYLSIAGALQSLGSGLAAMVGGFIISRDASGQLVNYARVGWFAVAMTALAIFLVGRIQLDKAAAEEVK
jgi:predicted MFS family arabinose efflux permease